MNFYHGFEDELIKIAKKKERIPGGASKDVPEEELNKKQLRAGVKVEKEHTPKASVAREIARDHLSEQRDKGEKQDYYTRLKKMEGSFKKADDEGGEEEKATGKMPGNVQNILKAFFRAHPSPSDDQVHELAEVHNVSPHVLEQQIYKLLGKALK